MVKQLLVKVSVSLSSIGINSLVQDLLVSVEIVQSSHGVVCLVHKLVRVNVVESCDSVVALVHKLIRVHVVDVVNQVASLVYNLLIRIDVVQSSLVLRVLELIELSHHLVVIPLWNVLRNDLVLLSTEVLLLFDVFHNASQSISSSL